MAMTISLGKRLWNTNACRIVEIRRADTVTAEMVERVMARAIVRTLVTSAVYLMVAMAAPVVGNVYAHQASENL